MESGYLPLGISADRLGLSVRAVTRSVDPAAHSGPQELADTSRPATPPGSGPDRKQPLGSVPSFPKRDSPSLTPAVHARVAGERLSQNGHL